MLVIWFNPLKENLYFRFYSLTDRKVNDTNSYGHFVVAVYDYDYDEKHFVNSDTKEIRYFKRLEESRVKRQKKLAIRNKIMLFIDKLFKV